MGNDQQMRDSNSFYHPHNVFCNHFTENVFMMYSIIYAVQLCLFFVFTKQCCEMNMNCFEMWKNVANMPRFSRCVGISWKNLDSKL